MKKSILIVGLPNSSKTTFITQLYGRLTLGTGGLKLYKSVSNLTPIIEALNLLADGEEVSPTSTDKSTGIELPIAVREDMVDLYCPDYGGEQVNVIIRDREIQPKWNDAIIGSNHWMLFIRLNNLTKRFDLSNKTISSENAAKQGDSAIEYSISDQSAYIELLQILLATKKQDAHFKNSISKLTIVLTCWDEEENGEKPIDKLKRDLPLLLTFVESNWSNDMINIVGLSALGLSLKAPENKKLYQENGSEGYSYVIKSDGSRINDITQLIIEAL